VSTFESRQALKRRYYRSVRNAIVASAALHLVAFGVAPPYLPRPVPMKADFLRVVSASGFTGEVARPVAAVPTGPEPASPASPRERVTVDAAIRTEPASAASVPASPGAAALAQGAEGGASGGKGGVREEPEPPVFYAYDAAPRITRRVEPEYSAAARAQGAEGTVIVNANIDEQGRVLRAWVAKSSAPEILIGAALDAVYQFEFQPGSQRDVPVKCTVAIPFQFHLKRTF